MHKKKKKNKGFVFGKIIKVSIKDIELSFYMNICYDLMSYVWYKVIGGKNNALINHIYKLIYFLKYIYRLNTH
jgi:hypothetical protein